MIAPPPSAPARQQLLTLAIRGLMVVATIVFAIASLVHFGVVIALGPLTLADPFSGAALPEAVIAAVLGLGSVAVLARWLVAWRLALATTLFAFLVTIYGLSVTVRSSRTGDLAYHAAILAVLAVIVGLLLLPAGRRSLSAS